MKKVSSVLTKLCLWLIYLVYIWGLLGPYSIYNNQIVKQNIFLAVMSLLIIPFIWNLICFRNMDFKGIVKRNVFIWIYTILRLYALCVVFSIDKSVLKTVCLEILFFIMLSEFFVKELDNIDDMIVFFIIFTFVCNCLTLFLYTKVTFNNIEFYPALKRIITANGGSLKAIIIRNTNFLGIITGLSMMLSFWYLRNSRVIFWLHFVLSSVFLVFSECRSAEIAIIFCCIWYLVKKRSSKISGKHIACFSLIFALGISMVISGYSLANSKNKKSIFDFQNKEKKLESFTTGRYAIWKADVNVSSERVLFGSGSFENLKKNRKKYLEKDMSKSPNARNIISNITYSNSHNGYIGLFAVTGITGLLFFILILLQRILIMDEQSGEKWYLPLSYFFVINIFEDYYLRTPIYLFIGLFLVMVIFSMGNKQYRI